MIPLLRIYFEKQEAKNKKSYGTGDFKPAPAVRFVLSRLLKKIKRPVYKEVVSGNISPADGRNIVAAANQINVSVQNELKLMKLQIDTGKEVNKLGELSIY